MTDLSILDDDDVARALGQRDLTIIAQQKRIRQLEQQIPSEPQPEEARPAE